MNSRKLQLVVMTGAMLLAAHTTAQAPEELKLQYLTELEHASGQVIALAEAIPAEKYAWRPSDEVRSFGQVFLHIALGNFLLLEVAGVPAPAELYGLSQSEAGDRRREMIKWNQELEKTIRDKKRVLNLLKRSLDSVKKSFTEAGEKDLARPLDFFGLDSQIRAVYLRILVHLNEHMGQAVAYARMNDIVPPWSRPRKRGNEDSR